MTLPIPFDLESDILRRQNIADQQFNEGYATDASVAYGLSTLNRDYPWLEPGAAVSFARSGMTSSSPGIHQVAQLSLGKQLRTRQVAKQIADLSLQQVSNWESRHQQFFDQLSPDQKTQVEGMLRQRGNKILGFDGGGPNLGDVIDFTPVAGAVKGIIEGQSPGEVLTRAIPGGKLAQGATNAIVSGGSQAVSAGTQAAQGVPVLGPAVEGLKSAARTAGLVAQTPAQEAQGFVRNAAEGVSQLSQGNFGAVFNPSSPENTRARINPVSSTQAGQAGLNIERGRPVDIGSGYLPNPNSPTGKAAAQVARQSAPTIGGHAFTIGRGLAAAVGTEPDTNSFNALSGVVDGTVAWFGDPANAVIEDLQEARAAHKFFTPEPSAVNDLATNTGLVASSAAPGIVKGSRTAYLDSPKGQTTLSRWAGMSPAEVWYDSNRKMPAELAKKVGDAQTPETVRAALDTPIFQPTMTPGGFNYQVRKLTDQRFFSIQATTGIHYTQDPNTFVPQLDRLLTEAHLTRAEKLPLMNAYFNDPTHAQAVFTVGNALEQTALKAGARSDVAQRIGKIVVAHDEGQRLYGIDSMTGQERSDRVGLLLDEANNPIPTPELTTEMLNTGVYFPSPRDVSRATSQFAGAFTGKPWSTLMAAPDIFLNAWRPLHVLKFGLPLRILADSQATLAANGYGSLFNHPIYTIGAIVGANMDKAWAQRLNAMAESAGAHMPDNLAKFTPTARYTFGPDGAPILPSLSANSGQALDVRQAALDNVILNRTQHAYSAYELPEKIALNDFVGVSRADPQAAEGMLAELNRMRGDPIMQGLAKQPDVETAKEWFATGPGASLRAGFQPIADNMDRLAAERVANKADRAASFIPYGDLSERANSDAFVESRLASLASRTGDHPDLLAAVRDGTINDVKLWKMHAGNRDAIPHIQAIFDAGEGPQMVKIQRSANVGVSAVDRLNHATQQVMYGLLTVPDRTLNQVPGWSQAVWHETPKYLPWLEPSEREAFFQAARDADLPRPLQEKLATVAIDGTTTERMSLKDLNYYAKADAVEKIWQLTHNIGSRSNAFDTMRLLFPFGDAFRLIAGRWLKTIADNPNVLRRTQQIIAGAQQSGFFHTDPQTGEQVFTYPGSQWLTKQLLGVPVPLTGQVSGLSIVGEGYPGVGPGITLPAQWLLPSTPQYDGIRDVIFPYGQPESKGVGQDIAGALMPPWLDKIVSGPPDQKTYNNTVGYMMQYLASTGRYDLHGANARSELVRLATDAKDKARWFYVIRGAAQLTSPSAPAPQWLAQDQSGHLAVTQVIKDDYRDRVNGNPAKHIKALGPDGAMQWLIDHYGENNVFLPQPFSTPVGFGVPTTSEGQQWAREHPEAKDKYPTTYGLFAPSTGKFDITAFENQFATGERKTLTPDEQVALAENRVGQWQYYRMRDRIIAANGGDPLSAAQSAWLSGYKDALAADYPGFGGAVVAQQGDPTAKRQAAVKELLAAAKDPALTQTDAGRGLAAYLALRQQAIDAVRQASNGRIKTPFQARSTAGIREWLRGAGRAVIQDHPQFRPMWEQVWDREMVTDVVGGG